MSTLDRIRASAPGIAVREVAQRDGLACIAVEPSLLHALCERLRDACGFETSTFVTAVDHFPKEPRFELVYQFRSLAHNDRVRVTTAVPSTNARVATITDLWPGSAYSERECFDMFGIVFDGHAGLKRLLMPDDYGHFPLRKDFPHQGIEPDRLYKEWDERRRARHEDHASP